MTAAESNKLFISDTERQTIEGSIRELLGTTRPVNVAGHLAGPCDDILAVGANSIADIEKLIRGAADRARLSESRRRACASADRPLCTHGADRISLSQDHRREPRQMAQPRAGIIKSMRRGANPPERRCFAPPGAVGKHAERFIPLAPSP